MKDNKIAMSCSHSFLLDKNIKIDSDLGESWVKDSLRIISQNIFSEKAYDIRKCVVRKTAPSIRYTIEVQLLVTQDKRKQIYSKKDLEFLEAVASGDWKIGDD